MGPCEKPVVRDSGSAQGLEGNGPRVCATHIDFLGVLSAGNRDLGNRRVGTGRSSLESASSIVVTNAGLAGNDGFRSRLPADASSSLSGYLYQSTQAGPIRDCGSDISFSSGRLRCSVGTSFRTRISVEYFLKNHFCAWQL